MISTTDTILLSNYFDSVPRVWQTREKKTIKEVITERITKDYERDCTFNYRPASVEPARPAVPVNKSLWPVLSCGAFKWPVTKYSDLSHVRAVHREGQKQEEVQQDGKADPRRDDPVWEVAAT